MPTDLKAAPLPSIYGALWRYSMDLPEATKQSIEPNESDMNEKAMRLLSDHRLSGRVSRSSSAAGELGTLDLLLQMQGICPTTSDLSCDPSRKWHASHSSESLAD